MSLILSALCIGAPEARGSAPKPRGRFLRWVRRISASCFCERPEILWGTANRRREAKQRPRSAPGAEKAPKQCPIPEAETIKAFGSELPANDGNARKGSENRLRRPSYPHRRNRVKSKRQSGV